MYACVFNSKHPTLLFWNKSVDKWIKAKQWKLKPKQIVINRFNNTISSVLHCILSFEQTQRACVSKASDSEQCSFCKDIVQK